MLNLKLKTLKQIEKIIRYSNLIFMKILIRKNHDSKTEVALNNKENQVKEKVAKVSFCVRYFLNQKGDRKK